jgi:hypothetical protein
MVGNGEVLSDCELAPGANSAQIRKREKNNSRNRMPLQAVHGEKVRKTAQPI